MSCLVHDKRYRSSFHNIINELRNEKRMSVPILRTMSKKCCTCHDENQGTIEPVIMKEENQMMKLKNLIERVNREKEINPKLILSLNRFEKLIAEHRESVPIVAESISVQKQEESSSSSDDRTSSSEDEDLSPMVISKPPIRHEKKRNLKIPKPSKPIKNGTFLFLPYPSEAKAGRKNSNSLVDVAKTLLRSRFISRNGHIGALEKQYGVRINMITPKTSQQVTEALENAKKGLDKLTIHNKSKSLKMSEKQEGAWVLIRSKKPQNSTNPTDIEQVLDDLTNRWDTCLNIRKRKSDEADNSDDSVGKKK